MKNATKLTLLYKNILTLLENYIKTYDLDVSVEELFVEFHRICLEHQKFELYLQEKEGNNFLNKMHRNKRLKEKRRLFELWYFSKHSDKGVTERFNDLSEITFVDPKTVHLDIFYENGKKK